MSTGLFSHKEWILLTSTPSLQYSNLSHCVDGKFCYVHLSEVVVVTKDGLSVQIPLPRAELYQAAFITITRIQYLIITSNVGVHLWSSDGTTMLFFYSFDDPSETDPFLRGIAAGCESNFFAVGSSNGDVLIFDVPAAVGSNQIVLQQTLKTDRVPIISIVSSSKYLISSNENGDIFGFNSSDKFSKEFRFNGIGIPCTSLILREEVLVSSYTNGSIRVHRLGILEMTIELAAHSGCINALAIHPQLDIFASCSEDQYVCVFSLPTFVDKPMSYIELLSSVKLENKPLTGLCFLANDTLAVSCYDSLELGILGKLK